MYVPAHFAEPDAAKLHALIEQYPLGVLFTHGASGMDANHIPFELHADEGAHGVLHAHVARANPVWQEVANDDEVLVVFRATDAYISPNWYPSKHALHKQVPTWNYIVAHAHGRITVRDDERYVRGLVARLTRTQEAGMAAPWKMTYAPREYIDTMLQAIVGIQIDITQLVGKTKMSQNKEARDIEGAAQGLKQEGKDALADLMLAYAANKASAS